MQKFSTLSNSPTAVWITTFGGIFVGSILILLFLTVFAGWNWVTRFLESSAPAWIQAVGSVAAIVAALAVVQRQHTLELERKEKDDLTAQLRRARSVRVLFYSAARACEDVARRIGKPYQTWNFLAQELNEVRARLLAIDPLLMSEGGLLLIIEECSMRLKSCALIVAELETRRKKETEDGIRHAVMATARECWLGFYESTALEAKLCKSTLADEQPYSFENFDTSRKHLDEIRSEFLQERREQSEMDDELPQK
jgi:hypothetical protein